VPTDEAVEAVYNTLIGASWENADHFEVHQNAWLTIANRWGVDYDPNAKGRKVTRFDPMPATPTQEETP
jgi:hypothetical protein